MDDLSYPVGRFEAPKAPLTERERSALIGQIAEAPGALRAAFAGLSAEQLDTPYRPGGWTARQVAHHVPDSHMNAYVRFRLALTEKEPTIQALRPDVVGRAPRGEDRAPRSVAGPPRSPAPTLGHAPAADHPRGVAAPVPPSRARGHPGPRLDARHVRLARSTPYRPRHVAAPAHGLVVEIVAAGFARSVVPGRRRRPLRSRGDRETRLVEGGVHLDRFERDALRLRRSRASMSRTKGMSRPSTVRWSERRVSMRTRPRGLGRSPSSATCR